MSANRRLFVDGEVRYVHFRNFTDNSAISIGFTYNPDSSEFTYAVAFCSPKDRFAKKKAHKILEGRLGSFRSLRIRSDVDLKYHDAIERIKQDYNACLWAKNFHMPSWAQRNFEEYLDLEETCKPVLKL